MPASVSRYRGVGGIGLELLAQLRHVEPQVAGVGHVVAPPDLREQRLPGHERARDCGRATRASATRSASGARVRRPRVTDFVGEVDRSRRRTHDGGSSWPAPSSAGERADAGEQLVDRERLRHVVVGAGVEGLDLVGRARCGPRRRGSGAVVQPRRAWITSTPSSAGMPRSSMTRSGCVARRASSLRCRPPR